MGKAQLRIDTAIANGYHLAIKVRSNQVPMTEATLLIKRRPADLKDWLASEAQLTHRSMNNGDVLSR